MQPLQANTCSESGRIDWGSVEAAVPSRSQRACEKHRRAMDSSSKDPQGPRLVPVEEAKAAQAAYELKQTTKAAAKSAPAQRPPPPKAAVAPAVPHGPRETLRKVRLLW